MYLVTGATGNVGREVVTELLNRGKKVRVFTRDAAKVADWGNRVEVAVGDFTQPETFAHAAAGVEGIFMMNGALELELYKALLASAKAQGEPRVVFLSSLFASIAGSTIGAMHKEKEDAIREAGLPGVFLRAGGFMTNSFQWIGPIRADNAVFNPMGHGKVAPIAPEDVAAVAVHALISSPVPEQILELTGDTLLSVPEQVRILAKTLGREIRCTEVPIDAAVESALRSGIPAEMADAARESFTAMRDGKAAIVTETVARVLGHPPMSYQTWANKHAARFV